MTELLSVLDVVDVLAETGISKVMDISLSMYETRSHVDLELLAPLEREPHTFVTLWGEFTPILEDV